MTIGPIAPGGRTGHGALTGRVGRIGPIDPTGQIARIVPAGQTGPAGRTAQGVQTASVDPQLIAHPGRTFNQVDQIAVEARRRRRRRTVSSRADRAVWIPD